MNANFRQTASTVRSGFTLVELLVVITIIGMLAGISLGALYSARESARVKKTEGTIAKLDMIVQSHYNSLLSRRMPLDSRTVGTGGHRITPRAMASMRLQALRFIAKSEMPNIQTDVSYPRLPGAAWKAGDMDVAEPLTVTLAGETWTIPIQRTALARRIFRKCASSPPSDEYSIAEMLYLWVSLADREAIETFQPGEIGDVDGDGYKEFADAWGMPIKSLRWPVGFVAESELMTGDTEDDHDPFDPRRVDGAAFRTVPLVWSNGPDKMNGINTASTVVHAWDNVFTTTDRGAPILPSDPTHGHEADSHHDNIHNHSLGMN